MLLSDLQFKNLLIQNVVKTKDIHEDDKSKIYESIRNMIF